MLKIEVVKSYTKDVTKKATGEVFHIPMVETYAHLPGEKYPIKVEFSVGKGENAPAPGTYMLGPKSLYVDQYGQLQVRRSLDLIPMSAKPTAAA
jgi:hypothetical protein